MYTCVYIEYNIYTYIFGICIHTRKYIHRYNMRVFTYPCNMYLCRLLCILQVPCTMRFPSVGQLCRVSSMSLQYPDSPTMRQGIGYPSRVEMNHCQHDMACFRIDSTIPSAS